MGLGKIADSVFNFNEGQFEKGAKSVLGVEFPVGEDWWPLAREDWMQLNYQTISGDMRKYVRDINRLVERAVTSGLSITELSGQIKALDEKLFKGRANFIARDQTGRLNGLITQRRMESIGLSMYIWETSGDERVRPSHEMMDGGLCLWSDSSVFSQDGGKTWIERPSGAVRLHPGDDYLCRCTATSYWNELVMEADEKIDEYEELDRLSERNIAGTRKPKLKMMT
jgi:SPP1 gp7 family putative phage head morphogenesis protein